MWHYTLTCGQSAGRQYASMIGWAPGDTNWADIGTHLEAFVVRKSVSHHHHSIWQGEACKGVPKSRDNGAELILPSFDRSTQFVWFLKHFRQASRDLCSLYSSSGPGTLSWSLTFFLGSFLEGNRSFPCILFGWDEGFTISPHLDWVKLEMYMEAVIEREWRCTCRLWSSEFGYMLRGQNWPSLEMNMQDMLEAVGCHK